MKDNKQNIADLIGTLAEDIEEIKKNLDAKDRSDKNGALESLAVRLGPVIRFFNGNTPENISGIFGIQEAIKDYKKPLDDEMITSLQLYSEANDKDMHKHGVLTIKEQLSKILEILTIYVENDRQVSEKDRQKHGFIPGLWQAIRPGKATNAIRLLWSKVPDGWHKNPYAWACTDCTFVFFIPFAVSWVQWHEYREEKQTVENGCIQAPSHFGHAERIVPGTGNNRRSIRKVGRNGQCGFHAGHPQPTGQDSERNRE